jgi:hypothetical protein
LQLLYVREAAPALGVPVVAGVATHGLRCPRAWVRRPSGLLSRASAAWPPQCSRGASRRRCPRRRLSRVPPSRRRATPHCCRSSTIRTARCCRSSIPRSRHATRRSSRASTAAPPHAARAWPGRSAVARRAQAAQRALCRYVCRCTVGGAVRRAAETRTQKGWFHGWLACDSSLW